MFDVSFSELMVIAVVALVVIGPERLPRVARTTGHLLGRLQRYVNNVKADINREMHIEDLKRFEQQVKSQIGDIHTSVNEEVSRVEASVTAGTPLASAAAPATEGVSPIDAVSPGLTLAAPASVAPVAPAPAVAAPATPVSHG